MPSENVFLTGMEWWAISCVQGGWGIRERQCLASSHGYTHGCQGEGDSLYPLTAANGVPVDSMVVHSFSISMRLIIRAWRVSCWAQTLIGVFTQRMSIYILNLYIPFVFPNNPKGFQQYQNYYPGATTAKPLRAVKHNPWSLWNGGRGMGTGEHCTKNLMVF